jgi:peptidoglycan/LPS O-acetylase OafA/YrhL
MRPMRSAAGEVSWCWMGCACLYGGAAKSSLSARFVESWKQERRLAPGSSAVEQRLQSDVCQQAAGEDLP